MSNVSMETNEETSVSKACWYTISKDELAGDVFVTSCHACNYGSSSVA